MSGILKIQPAILHPVGFQERGWKYRAIEATKGNLSAMGCIVIAICGRQPKHPPRFDMQGAEITVEGIVLANWQGKDDWQWNLRAPVCTIGDLVDNFRGLADHLKLSDVDRTAMFDELRKWIVKDHRATSGELE